MSAVLDKVSALIASLQKLSPIAAATNATAMSIAETISVVANDEGSDITLLQAQVDALNPSAGVLQADTIQEATSGAGVAFTQPITYSLTTGITAGTTQTQAGATALTSELNNITTVAVTNDGVKLPAAIAGKRITVKNGGANVAKIYPFLGDFIDDELVNVAITIPVEGVITFIAISGTTWESSVETGTFAVLSATTATITTLGVTTTNASGVSTFSDATGVTTNTVTERTAASGVTVDGVLLKDGGVSANSMYAGFYPTAAQQTLTGAGAVNVTSYLTNMDSNGGAMAATLASGAQIGQRKKIVLAVDGGDATLTLTGYTSIVFNDAADYVELIWSGAAWFVLVNSGCTVNA